MTASRRRPIPLQIPRRSRRASVLLELMLAVALFILAGGAVTAAIRQALSAVERTRLESVGADYAWSALAMIASGQQTPQSLQGDIPQWNGIGIWDQGGQDDAGAVTEIAAEPSGWSLEIETEPTETDGLSMVTVHAVFAPEGELNPRVTVSASERVELREGTPAELENNDLFDAMGLDRGRSSGLSGSSSRSSGGSGSGNRSRGGS